MTIIVVMKLVVVVDVVLCIGGAACCSLPSRMRGNNNVKGPSSIIYGYILLGERERRGRGGGA